MNYLEAVNRVLREEGIIRGDDTDATAFTDTQHGGTLSLAKIAIEQELAYLVAQDFLPYEDKDAEITLVTGQRTYSLESDFIRFQENYFLRVDGSSKSENVAIPIKKGDKGAINGQEWFRMNHMDYRDEQGTVIYAYTTGGTSKKVGFWQVPDSNENGQVLRYYYEGDVSVSSESDTLPFTTTTEANVFVSMASRHFKYLFATPQIREGLFPNGLEKDSVLAEARANLKALLSPVRPPKKWKR